MVISIFAISRETMTKRQGKRRSKCLMCLCVLECLRVFALLLRVFALLLRVFALLLRVFALLLRVFALLLRVFATA